jgi:hypothetical protein
VLQLDPANRPARQLRESLIDRQRRQQIRSRVESLVGEAKAERAQRRFGQAIPLLEDALRLDSSDPEIQELLDQTKKALERSRLARRFLADAHGELSAGTLDAAYRKTKEALEADPEDPDAAALCEQLLERIEAEFVNSAQSRVGEFEAGRQWDKAVAEAEDALKHYPNNPELRTVLHRIREEAARERRRQEWEVAVGQAERALSSRDWAAAAEALRLARERFPTDSGLDRLEQSLSSGQRQEALEKLHSGILQLFSEGNLDEAARQIAAAQEQFSGEAVWQQLRQELTSREAYERSLEEAERYWSERAYRRAEAILESVIDTPAFDIRAARLLESVRAERRENDRKEAIAEARSAVEQFVREGKFAEGLAVLDRTNYKYPDDPALEDERKSVAAALEQQRRERQRQEGIEARRALDDAARQLAGCPPKQRENPLWHSLDEELRRRGRVSDLLAEAEQLSTGIDDAVLQQKLRDARSVDAEDLRVAASRTAAFLDGAPVRKKIAFGSLPQMWMKALRWTAAGGMLLLAGMGIVVLLGVVLFVYLETLPGGETVPVPSPRELSFAYRPGDADPPRQFVAFKSPAGPFHASADNDWLVVTPRDGDRLEFLQVTLNVRTIERMLQFEGPSNDLTNNYSTSITVRMRGQTSQSALAIPVHLRVGAPLTGSR